ncbi:MAG: hypothetical protein K0R24_2424 [Gammaproteobacteria bacterium]|jgi:hypothetical protein|nr:hypothetical protein [Gammaproteobacteria bacterium]
MKKLKLLFSLIIFIFYTNPLFSSDSDEEEKEENSLSHTNIESQIKENNLLVINEHEGSKKIYIYGLKSKIACGDELYSSIIEEMSEKIRKIVSKSWYRDKGGNEYSKYESFSFSGIDFDRELLEDVGRILEIYSHIHPKSKPGIFFDRCYFNKSDLANDKRKIRKIKINNIFKNASFKNCYEDRKEIN